MTDRICIARELMSLARELVAADYKHKKDYTDADEEERYANELAYTVYDHFKNGRLDEKVVDYTVKVSPKRFLKRHEVKTDAQNNSYDVRVIMFYRDEVGSKDMPCIEALKSFQNNCDGEAHTDDLNNLAIVISGYASEDWCDESYFYDTFAHEMMHILDSCAYKYVFSLENTYGKQTKHEKKRNIGIAYPVGNVDVLDPKYAEYYTCENEIREYRNDIRKVIRQYCEQTQTEWNDAVKEIKEVLKNEQTARRFIESFNGNQSPFATLYHLCFSNPSHGNRQTAMKLLDGLREEI